MAESCHGGYKGDGGIGVGTGSHIPPQRVRIKMQLRHFLN